MCGGILSVDPTENIDGVGNWTDFSNPNEPHPEEKVPVKMFNVVLGDDMGELLEYRTSCEIQNIVNCGSNPMAMNRVISH